MQDKSYQKLYNGLEEIVMFKFLDRNRKDQAPQERSGSLAVQKPDPAALQRIAHAHALDQQAIDAARDRLSGAYLQLLNHMDKVYRSQEAEQRARIEANYEVWASFFELIKENFKDLWAFFGVIKTDVTGWHRTSPTGSPFGYVGINRSGYSFAAGLEQNSKKGAPFPKKWLTVSLAHTTSYEAGIGDERLVGRPMPITDELKGLAGCTEMSGDKQEDGSRLLRAKAEEFPLVFTLSNESRGQHATQLPLSVLKKYTLTELAQPLIVALTNDDMKQAVALLPSAERLKLPKP